jgi:hypothetical protein
MKTIILGALLLFVSCSSKGASLADSNCNPGNIRFSKTNQWEGQTGSNKGFAVFKSPEYGARAAFKLLKKRDGQTVSQIINAWAPPSENSTNNYIQFVCKQTGLTKNEKIDSDSEREKLLNAIARMEGSKITKEQIKAGIKLA